MAGKGHLPTQFKKGQSGNPKGRPKTREDLKKVKLMSSDNAARLIQKIMDMSPDEIRVMVEDPKTPAWELMVARIVDKAIREGDTSRLNFLFDRTIGKVVEKKEVELKPVTYQTAVRPEDGALIQEVLDEEEISEEKENDVEVESMD